jgi:hypothetical protein
MTTIPHARKNDHPATLYLQFEPKRDQKEGLNSAATTDPNPGFSPVTRWLCFAFDYADFASNPDLTGYKATVLMPRDTIALRAVVRVDTAFDNASSVNVGDDTDPNGWANALDLESTGAKFDPDAAYQPGGTTGGVYYADGDTVDIETATGTAPTAGQGLLFIEVISYHEDANAEW